MSDTFAVLDQAIAIKRVSGNKKLADDLLLMFINELPGYKQGIEQEVNNTDREELRKIIHKMHGGLRYIGAPALLDIISQTDMELLAFSDKQLKQNIRQIFDEIERLLKQGKYSTAIV